jgi:hypothetical protein
MQDHHREKAFTPSHETEDLYLALLGARQDRRQPTDRERALLRQPVTPVRPDNIFTWHLNQHSVIETETDPERIRQRIWQRRTGVTAAGRLTEAQIVAQEQRLGVRLPLPWRDVYRYFNGGWVDSLYWGDGDDPRIDDVAPVPEQDHQYLALEDVAPLADILPGIWVENDYGRIDGDRIDRGLIAIALAGTTAVLLDYRAGEVPRVCLAYFSKYDDDPLAGWETDSFTVWWPNMEVFFRGLYRQDRAS